MNKYRKKPVEIEAIQFTGQNTDEIFAWSQGNMASFELGTNKPYEN